MSAYPNQFEAVDVLAAVLTILKADLGAVDVECIGEKDYNEASELTITPPAVRLLFVEETEPTMEESQALNYSTKLKFVALCADEDLSADPQQQRNKSMALASLVKRSLVGARLQVATGVVSEPVRYLGMQMLNAEGFGLAYVPGFEVQGIAQFDGPHR